MTGAGMDALVLRVGRMVHEAREAAREIGREYETVYRVRAAEDTRGFEVKRTGAGSYEVHGESVERMVIMTEMGNEEAVAYLQKRLAKMGVEKALVAAGAGDGDEVTIAGATFIFEGVGAGDGDREGDGADEEDGRG